MTLKKIVKILSLARRVTAIDTGLRVPDGQGQYSKRLSGTTSSVAAWNVERWMMTPNDASASREPTIIPAGTMIRRTRVLSYGD